MCYYKKLNVLLIYLFVIILFALTRHWLHLRQSHVDNNNNNNNSIGEIGDKITNPTGQGNMDKYLNDYVDEDNNNIDNNRIGKIGDQITQHTLQENMDTFLDDNGDEDNNNMNNNNNIRRISDQITPLAGQENMDTLLNDNGDVANNNINDKSIVNVNDNNIRRIGDQFTQPTGQESMFKFLNDTGGVNNNNTTNSFNDNSIRGVSEQLTQPIGQESMNKFLSDNSDVANGNSNGSMSDENAPPSEKDNAGRYVNVTMKLHMHQTTQPTVIRDGNEVIANYEDLNNIIDMEGSFLKLDDEQTSPAEFCHLCRYTEPEFLHESKPFVALASFPGSGNSWTRELIESITGVYTGSVYNDKWGQFPGSKRCPLRGGVYIVKTHATGHGMKHPECRTLHAVNYQKAIYILRNPYNAILSTFNLVHGGKVNFAPRKAFQAWRTYVQKNARAWKLMVLYWLKKIRMPLHVIVYEKLTKDIPSELFKLGMFLNLESSYIDLYCAKSCLKPKYHRVNPPQWMNTTTLYDDKAKTIVNAAINDVIHALGDAYDIHVVQVLKTYLV